MRFLFDKFILFAYVVAILELNGIFMTISYVRSNELVRVLKARHVRRQSLHVTDCPHDKRSFFRYAWMTKPS